MEIQQLGQSSPTSPLVPYIQLTHSGKLSQLNISLPLVPNPMLSTAFTPQGLMSYV